MIVLDTNVVSELMTNDPDPRVREWLADQPGSMLATTAVTIAEIAFGLALLPAGRRRDAMVLAYRRTWAIFAAAVLPFDRAAAEVFGVIMASRQEAGRPMAVLDAQIAAVCLSRNAGLATRNVKDFQGLGLDMVNPWNHPGA